MTKKEVKSLTDFIATLHDFGKLVTLSFSISNNWIQFQEYISGNMSMEEVNLYFLIYFVVSIILIFIVYSLYVKRETCSDVTWKNWSFSILWLYTFFQCALHYSVISAVTSGSVIMQKVDFTSNRWTIQALVIVIVLGLISVAQVLLGVVDTRKKIHESVLSGLN